MAGPGWERIFLYGTLRRGGSRDALVHYGQVEFVSRARVRGILFDLGSYPGLRLKDDAGWVIGELFDVDSVALAQLDDWEGIDPVSPESGEYLRVKIQVARYGGVAETCWVYEIKPEACDDRSIVWSGDWLAHIAERG